MPSSGTSPHASRGPAPNSPGGNATWAPTPAAGADSGSEGPVVSAVANAGPIAMPAPNATWGPASDDGPGDTSEIGGGAPAAAAPADCSPVEPSAAMRSASGPGVTPLEGPACVLASGAPARVALAAMVGGRASAVAAAWPR